MTKQEWLDRAEIVDALRVVPRLLLIAYCAFTFHIVSWILEWYMALPAAERSLESSGLAAAVITAVTGLGSWFLKVYTFSGRHWNAENDSTNT